VVEFMDIIGVESLRYRDLLITNEVVKRCAWSRPSPGREGHPPGIVEHYQGVIASFWDSGNRIAGS
jgi:hypothetical protein